LTNLLSPALNKNDSIPSLKVSNNISKKSINSGKILIVDDEKFNCDIIFGFLMVLGMAHRKTKTDFAYNGE